MQKMYWGNNISGWMTNEELQFLYENASKVNSVLEVGSWKGRSTHALLSGCKGEVTAVDHFKGSDNEPNAHAEAKQDDEPIYRQFLTNVGSFPNIRILKMSSEEAKKVVGDQKFDMIFIDANHTYEGVKTDIALWKDNARLLLCGHDYCGVWPGVMKAVDESVVRDGVCASIWYKKIQESSKIEEFTEKIKRKENFSFIKRGDGEEACMNGELGSNCDNHPYSKELGDKLRESYAYFNTRKDCFVPTFDQQPYFNSLLHRTDSDRYKVQRFYAAIREDDRHKIYVGPKRLEKVSKLLGAEHIIVPEVNSFSEYDKILDKLKTSIALEDRCIVMFSSGMPSKPMIAECLRADRQITCLDLGSAFDPLVNQTRTMQLDKADMVILYLDWIFPSWLLV